MYTLYYTCTRSHHLLSLQWVTHSCDSKGNSARLPSSATWTISGNYPVNQQLLLLSFSMGRRRLQTKLSFWGNLLNCVIFLGSEFVRVWNSLVSMAITWLPPLNNNLTKYWSNNTQWIVLLVMLSGGNYGRQWTSKEFIEIDKTFISRISWRHIWCGTTATPMMTSRTPSSTRVREDRGQLSWSIGGLEQEQEQEQWWGGRVSEFAGMFKTNFKCKN